MIRYADDVVYVRITRRMSTREIAGVLRAGIELLTRDTYGDYLRIVISGFTEQNFYRIRSTDI